MSNHYCFVFQLICRSAGAGVSPFVSYKNKTVATSCTCNERTECN